STSSADEGTKCAGTEEILGEAWLTSEFTDFTVVITYPSKCHPKCKSKCQPKCIMPFVADISMQYYPIINGLYDSVRVFNSTKPESVPTKQKEIIKQFMHDTFIRELELAVWKGLNKCMLSAKLLMKD